jgi:hypothetical protein
VADRGRSTSPPALCGAAFLLLLLWPASPAHAYTAAGDRNFPATLVLPQAAPGDQLYVTPSYQANGGGDDLTSLTTTFGKTLTDNLGIQIQEGYNWLGSGAFGGTGGAQNLILALKYEAFLDPRDEFFFTTAVDREFGGSGSVPAGATSRGATMPTLYFGKGFNEAPVGWLRPLALVGMVRYEISDGAPRPDVVRAGGALEYSIPYLQSKVKAYDLPDFVRHLTPLVEFQVTTPVGAAYAQRTAALVAPGISYAGEGWEFAVEALLPANRAAGTGVGVIAQLYLSLDYLMPESLGRPLFSRY